MNSKARMIVLLAALFAPSAFAASIFITSRDGGFGDLYQYGLDGGLLQTISGNGLNNGQGVTLGPDGKLYVASEAGKSVLRYDASTGAFLSTFVSGLSTSPGPLAFGPNGNLYVGAGNKIWEFDSSGLLVATIGLGTNLSSVSGLAFDADGNLYASDGVMGIVNKFNPTGGFLSTIVSGNAAFVNGAGPLLINDSTLLVAATFGSGATWGDSILAFGLDGAAQGDFINDPNLDGPAGMAFGPDGNFYVVNYAGGNVVRFTEDGSFLDTFIPNNPAAGRFIAFAVDAVAVPEPASAALLALGLFALAIGRRRLTVTVLADGKRPTSSGGELLRPPTCA